VKLDALAARLPGSVVHGGAGAEVTEVTYDSRRAGPGTIFVAVRGLTTDGNQFVDAARRKGVSAVASESPPQPGGPWIQVPDARRALAAFSAAVLGDPSSSLRLVGVTGTNGKTTTSYLIDAAVRAAGHTAGLLGTVQYRIGDRLSEAVRTTPEASDLQQRSTPRAQSSGAAMPSSWNTGAPI
jgi:UDP-N-acetylmuramoyl-L-alanyl-D-glutamate--2,6-diaminopimelate ligase